MLHAAAVHLPIALSILGLPCVLLAVVFHRVAFLRGLALVVYLLLAGSAYYAEGTGAGARGLVPPTLSQVVWDAIERHEVRAERIKVAGILVAALLIVSFIPQPRVRLVAGLLALLGSLVTGYLVAAAAHEGGLLVYQYGVGTPHMKAITPAPLPAPAPPLPPAEPAPQVDVAEDPADLPVDAPVAAPEPIANTMVIPATDALQNPEWLPVREIDLAAARTVVFSRDIWPIFDRQCLDCHSAPHPDGDYDMTTRELMLLPGAKAGAGVIPGDPDNSSIVQYIRGVLKPRMPHKSDPLTEDELHAIRQWIAAGAEVDAMP